MNKLNPQTVAIEFEAEINKILSYLSRTSTLLKNTTTEAADLSLLNEHVFLTAAISFESVISDLYFSYINKDSTLFIANKEQAIKKSIEESHGSWYANKISIPHLKHISAGDLYPLLDPRGFNITFKNARQMVSQAKKNLHPSFVCKYTAITPNQRKIIDVIKAVRNYIAHRSDSAFEVMTKALSSLSNGQSSSLGRCSSKRVRSIGAYLKTKTGTGMRTEVYLTAMKDIVNVIGC